MWTQSTRPASPCPEDGYTRIPTSLHALVESPREFQLVALLLSYRWYPTSPIIPSVETLASRLGCSARTVRRTAARLEERGLLLRVARRAEDDRQMSNEYELCGPLLASVTALEDAPDREARPPWPGRRTRSSGETQEPKHTNGNRRTGPDYTRRYDARPPGSYLETRR